jgi:NAD(P)H-hydrate epimerase
VVLRPLPAGPGGVLAAEAADEVIRLAERADAVVLGPGVTTADGPASVARRLVRELPCPLVVDADALNALAAAGERDALLERDAPTLCTPHPGEMARLLGVDIAAVQADRISAARRLSGPATACVLKGAGSVVAGEGRILVNRSGNPGLATLGTGDVLAGMAGALLAQGLSPFEAGALASWLHGRAGDLAAAALSEPSIIATDVLGHIPGVVRELIGT